jgi:class 3 adenylate cyclase
VAGLTETQYATVDGRSIAYQVHGSGDLELLVLDGWIRSVELDWDDPGYARLLQRDGTFARVIRYDGRGSGMSDPDARPDRPVLESWVQDAIDVLDTVGAQRCAVFGLGLGGPVALRLAARHADRVGALVVTNSFARLRVADDQPFGLTPQEVDGALELVRTGWGTGVTLDLYGAGHDDVARSRMARYERGAASPGVAVRLMTALADEDVRADLPSITARTLVTHTHNPVLDVRHGEAIAAAIPGAMLDIDPADSWSWRREADEYRTLDRLTEFLIGVPLDADSDRAFAAMVFTDIVGSTSTAAALGDRRWRLLIDAHDAETQRQVHRAGGRIVTSTGDGVLAIFAAPSQALACAIAVRDALREHDLGVRTSVHAAEIEVRGDQVGGIGVHIAARINAAAEPGEILVSNPVAELVAGAGYEFAHRGSHSFKGVPTPCTLWSLVN